MTLIFICSVFQLVHCRCSKCYSVPTRKRVRKRTPDLTLLSLPEDVLLCVLQCLSAEDLLSVRAVSTHTGHTNTSAQGSVSPACFCCWSTFFLSTLRTNAFYFCHRFTPNFVISLTTIPVYGLGSVLETPGRPPTLYGYLKGRVNLLMKQILHTYSQILLFVFDLRTSFFRSAEKGNFEAAVKLGIAYLYNEGRKFDHP